MDRIDHILIESSNSVLSQHKLEKKSTRSCGMVGYCRQSTLLMELKAMKKKVSYCHRSYVS